MKSSFLNFQNLLFLKPSFLNKNRTFNKIHLKLFKRFESSGGFKNELFENKLKNDLIEWINKKHSNKGDDLETALEIVKNDDWDVLCDYTENQWKENIYTCHYNKVI